MGPGAHNENMRINPSSKIDSSHIHNVVMRHSHTKKGEICMLAVGLVEHLDASNN